MSGGLTTVKSDELDALIAELRQLLPRRPEDDLRSFWAKEREVSDAFRSRVRYPTRDERDRAWRLFNELRDAARELVERRADMSGWRRLDTAIDELASLVEGARSIFSRLESEVLTHPLDHALSTGAIVYDWRPVWQKARDIQTLFSSRPFYPTKSARDESWTRFNDLRNEASRLANADREMRQFISNAWRDKIISRAEDARYSKLWDSIETALLLPTTADDMKHMGEILRSAGQLLHDNKHQMLAEHKEACFARIQEIRQTHAEFWDRRREAFDERRRAHERRVDDVLLRVEANLERNHERLRNAEDALTRAESHIDDLREKIATAWSDGARDRFETWLAEAEARRDSIRESVERAQAWIAQDEERRNDIYRHRR